MEMISCEYLLNWSQLIDNLPKMLFAYKFAAKKPHSPLSA
jgi:hypothetical protein